MPAHFHTVYDWASGTTWIADGSQRIAQIEPPRLKNLALRPGGTACVTWLTFFWWQYVANEQPGRSAWLVRDVSIDDRDPACFRLRVRSYNSERSVLSECSLALRFDARLASYIYAVETSLVVLPGKEWVIEPQGGVEFANPWYREAVGAAAAYPGAAPARWQWVVYTDPRGKLVRLPLNHLGSPLLERIYFPPGGGWLGFFNNAGENPVIELDADTAASTRAEVCAWGYDLHLIRRVPPEDGWAEAPLEQEQAYPAVVLKAGQRLAAQYRLYSLPGAEGARLLEQATAPELPADLAEKLRRPAVTLPASSFLEDIDPAQPSSAWYWSPFHGTPTDDAVWERGSGLSGSASLHLRSTEARLAYWETPIGPDFWMGPLPAEPQQLSVWIRTRDVSGPGACLTYRYSSYEIETGQQLRLPQYESQPVRGDSDWQQVALLVEPPPPGATRAYLRLALNGPGEAWFDNLRFEPLAQA